ncbi:hypothetical protein RIR_jg11066.t1 [Rhizophagus irregularis DAOM 181602=DAOM 197198]|nr:hypothetical protein RIR_jg11066.t1 [Rhizophagus irregularis DAOM 181602=DAOM 197198]
MLSDIVNHLNINSSELKQIAERIDEVEETTLKKARTQLEDCSFASHLFFLDDDNLMIVDEYDEYDSYSNNHSDTNTNTNTNTNTYTNTDTDIEVI